MNNYCLASTAKSTPAASPLAGVESRVKLAAGSVRGTSKDVTGIQLHQIAMCFAGVEFHLRSRHSPVVPADILKQGTIRN